MDCSTGVFHSFTAYGPLPEGERLANLPIIWQEWSNYAIYLQKC